jgi:protein-disulfide isomerase
MSRLSKILIAAAVLAALQAGPSLWTGLSMDGGRTAPGWGYPAPAAAQQPPADRLAPRREGDDFAMGHPDAPVVVIEYASLTCPHCARFHADVLPQVKAKYIDAGIVKFVYRDFPLDRVALQAAQVARCLPPERYFGLLDVLFRQQEQWTAGRDAGAMIERVKQYATLAGLPRDRAAACAEDAEQQAKLVAVAQAGEKQYGVSSTPTLVINGKRHAGGSSFEEVDRALAEAARGQPAAPASGAGAPAAPASTWQRFLGWVSGLFGGGPGKP